MYKAIWKFLFPKYIGKNYDTVRYAFPLVLITAILASVAAVVTSNASYVTVRSEQEFVARDQEFYIDVSINAHVPINAIDLQIVYPKERLEVLGIDTGNSVITLWTEEPHAKDGTIFLRGGTFRKGFIDEHSIARVKVRALEAGEARVVIKDTQLVAGDGLGTEVDPLTNTSFNETKIMISGADGIATGKASISIVTDIDGDGDVDLVDISNFMSAWFTKRSTYDFDGDGRMTFRDFSILLTESFLK